MRREKAQQERGEKKGIFLGLSLERPHGMYILLFVLGITYFRNNFAIGAG